MFVKVSVVSFNPIACWGKRMRITNAKVLETTWPLHIINQVNVHLDFVTDN